MTCNKRKLVRKCPVCQQAFKSGNDLFEHVYENHLEQNHATAFTTLGDQIPWGKKCWCGVNVSNPNYFRLHIGYREGQPLVPANTFCLAEMLSVHYHDCMMGIRNA